MRRLNSRRRQLMIGVGAALLAGTTGCAGFEQLQMQGGQWRPEGASTLGRIGVLTPHFDPVPETSMSAMAPVGITIHAARVWLRGDARAFSDPPHIDEATDLLVSGNARSSGLGPSAILLAFTTTSYLLGAEGEGRVRARLEQRSNGAPVILSGEAATAALRALGAGKISLIHPPWFSSNDQGATYFRSAGFDVVQATRMEPARPFTEVAPDEVFTFVSEHTPASAEAVFIGGNGLRAVGAIEALEARLGRPVITANQVLLWDALRRMGHANRVRGYGRIFQL